MNSVQSNKSQAAMSNWMGLHSNSKQMSFPGMFVPMPQTFQQSRDV